jgi:hypothetical protein
MQGDNLSKLLTIFTTQANTAFTGPEISGRMLTLTRAILAQLPADAQEATMGRILPETREALMKWLAGVSAP